MRTDTAPLDCGHDPATARPSGTATDEHGRRTCIPCHGAAAYRRTVEYGAIVTGYDTGLPSGRTLADAVAPGAGFAGGPGARTGRNPKTGAPIKIPSTHKPKFTPGATFKDLVKD